MLICESNVSFEWITVCTEEKLHCLGVWGFSSVHISILNF